MLYDRFLAPTHSAAELKAKHKIKRQSARMPDPALLPVFQTFVRRRRPCGRAPQRNECADIK
jgi:hypothetical protein